MPDIMAANEKAGNGGIARSMERNQPTEAFMRIKDHSLGSSIQDATLAGNCRSQKKSDGLLSTKIHNRTSMQNYKQNRMFYYNHAREDGVNALRGDRAGDVNHSLNFGQNARTHADNFISNVGGQPNNN